MKKIVFIVFVVLLSLPLCAADWYVSTTGNDANPGSMASPFLSIQKAIDVASSFDIIHVAGGTYQKQIATNRSVFGVNGPHQFGLFIDKDNLTVRGYTDNWTTLPTSASAAGVMFTTGATNNFGSSGIFVQANGVTISGLKVGDNYNDSDVRDNNKTIEVVGDGFSMEKCWIATATDEGAMYFGEWDSMHEIGSYSITNNKLENTLISINNGVGTSGLRANRLITNNEFVGTATPYLIGFRGWNGPNPAQGWIVYPCGGAILTGNDFSGMTALATYVVSRGNSGGIIDSELDWNEIWTSNIYGNHVVALSDETNFVPRAFNDGTYPEKRQISPMIQENVTIAQTNDVVLVSSGNFQEDLIVSTMGVTLKGSGYQNTTVTGPIGGGGSTVQVSASNVTIDGFKLTRAGNNPSDWNSALNTAGVSIQGLGITNCTIQNCEITGNRTGIDLNNTGGHSIHNNVIDGNRTGMILRNQTDNCSVYENSISDNWTVGILFLDASGGTNSPLQQALGSSFFNNKISGNWYGQIVDRQSGGSLPMPGANGKNFECNWYGTATPMVSMANSAEPGYSAQIPVAYGGSATPPGGQPDILGPASANFDFSPILYSGTDVSMSTGFQPNFDADGDGFASSCGGGNDCDDNNAAIKPGATEVCGNTTDDDCDAVIDEDQTNPTANCQNAYVALDGMHSGSVSGPEVNNGSSDNCTAVGNLMMSVSPNTFDCDDVGTVSVTLTVTDESGNPGTCTATVTVLDVLNYTENPGRRTALDGLANDHLGWGLGLDGTVAIAGAPDDKVGTQSKQGSAYVFYKDQGGANNWGQLKQIKASDGAAVDYFGNAVSIDGGLALVAAHGDNVGATTDAGSVYIYEQNAGGTNNWGQQANIIARDGSTAEPVSYDYFGNAASLKNGRALVGAAKKKVGANNAQGAAYIYEQNAGGTNNWGNVKKLTASDGAANNFFGNAVGQSNGLLLVGANGNLSNRGAAYLYGQNTGGTNNWGLVKKLTASDAAVGDGFGTSVSLSGDYVLAGAPNKATYAGAAYVFKKDQGGAGNWGQVKKLAPADLVTNDRFGASVALTGDYAYVTALRGNSDKGAVYVFHKNQGGSENWGQIGKYVAAAGAAGDQFGYALGVSGNTMAVGANLDDVDGKLDQGAVYFFTGADCPDMPKPTDETTSTAELTEKTAPQVRCQPNPFRDELVIEILSQGATHLQVTDAAGRLMVEADLPAGATRFDLNSSSFRGGLYFVQVSGENGVRVVPVALVR